MNTAPLHPADTYTMPRPARHVHLYLAVVDGAIVAPEVNRRPAACMRTGTSVLQSDVTYTYGTASDSTLNQAGRVKFVKHQSGTETREYGSLGEVVKETIILTAAANGGSNPPGYTTQYDFDSFGRLHKLMMPDGEIITNHYDSGGNLNAVDGTLNGRPYKYLERLDYDRFESRVYLKVGNGVETSYTYDPNNRRRPTSKPAAPARAPCRT